MSHGTAVVVATTAMTDRPRTVVLQARFNGPPGSANGGYACGMAAGALTDGPAEVVLRRPPPLDVPLDVVPTDGGIELHDAGQVVAIARHWDGTVDVPPPPDPSVVDAAVSSLDLAEYARTHAFDRCFTCGPARAEGDGLRLFPGPIPEAAMVAWPWTPAPSIADADGVVSAPVVWAALDCPTGLTWIQAADGATTGPAVLGRLSARIDRRPAVGEDLVVAGWQIAVDGRKLSSGGAVWSADGEVFAASLATWVVLDEEQAAAFGARS